MNAIPDAPDTQAEVRKQAFFPSDTQQAGSPSARKMIAFYEQQLSHLPETGRERADALLGLAEALLDSYGSDFVVNIEQTLHLVQDALHLLTPDYHPYDWVRGQNDMGIALAQLPTGNRNVNLLQAIQCYQNALRLYTETDFPMQWADTQNNLGIAYKNLPGGDRAQNLLQAIQCYQDALRVRTETDFPMDWAMTQFNLALAHEESDNRTAARRAMEQSVRGYRHVGMLEDAQEGEEWLRDHP